MTQIKENISATSKITVIDIERENRLSNVISLHSNGLNQEEIALELHVDQSTVSRDLQCQHDSEDQDGKVSER